MGGENTHLDLSREEMRALGSLQDALLWSISPRRTKAQTESLKQKLYRALPPDETAVQGTPLWSALSKIHKASGSSAPPEFGVEHVFTNLRDWLEALVMRQKERGCPYEKCDDPKRRCLGMRDVESGALFLLPVNLVVDMTQWKISLPRSFAKLLTTPDLRRQLARVLSTGDHCLEFSSE